MRLLITSHESVVEFARTRFPGDWSVQPFLSIRHLSDIPLNAQIFGSLPLSTIATTLSSRPDLRYYQLMVPQLKQMGFSLPHLLTYAYFRRYHVEELETYDGASLPSLLSIND